MWFKFMKMGYLMCFMELFFSCGNGKKVNGLYLIPTLGKIIANNWLHV